MLNQSIGVYKPTFEFQFEKQFDDKQMFDFMKQHWADSFIYSLVYLIVIFCGKEYMKSRQRFDLRYPLVAWSGTLAVFSICGAIRTFPEFTTTIKQHGLKYSVCVPSHFRGITGFWTFIFTISKAIELGDTVFIVARKQPLIFLHWYHHITVLVCSWLGFAEQHAPVRWFMVINLWVHSFMYTYYTLRALRFHVPRTLRIFITFFQIIQMIIGSSINVWIYIIVKRGELCAQSFTCWCLGIVIYPSYVILFANFFYKSYLVKEKAGPDKVKEVKKKSN